MKVLIVRCFQGCWRDVEAEVLQSLKGCQQQVSTLLADVHQQRYRPRHTHQRPRPDTPTRGPAPDTPVYLCRLALLQTFEDNITSQLKHLQQTSAGLSSMNADILVLVLVQVEVQVQQPGLTPGLWSCLPELVPQGEAASGLLL